MSNQLETNLEIILNEKITKILPENIKSGVTILGVDGTFEGGTQLPEGIFVQSDVPTKTTNEAIWLKQSAADDTPFLDKLPDEVLNAYINGNKSELFSKFIEALSETQKQEINSAKKHVIRDEYLGLDGWTHYWTLTITLDVENSDIAYNNNSFIYRNTRNYTLRKNGTIYVSNTTGDTPTSTSLYPIYNLINSNVVYMYTDTILATRTSDGFDYTVPTYTPNIEFVTRTEEGLNIINGDTMTTVYMNKGTEFEKILDTSNADAIAGDIVEGKTAFVNNTKITGTLTVPMSQEEYNTALSTANNILGNTSDTFVLLNDMPNGELKEYLRIPKSFSISNVGMNKLSNLGTDNLHCTNIDIDGGAGYFLINHIGSDNMYFDLCLEMAYFAQWNYNSSTGMFELDDTRNGDKIATVEGDYVYLSNPNGIMIKNGDIDTDIWGMIFIDTSK